MQVGIPVAYNVCEVKLDKINHWICVYIFRQIGTNRQAQFLQIIQFPPLFCLTITILYFIHHVLNPNINTDSLRISIRAEEVIVNCSVSTVLAKCPMSIILS